MLGRPYDPAPIMMFDQTTAQRGSFDPKAAHTLRDVLAVDFAAELAIATDWLRSDNVDLRITSLSGLFAHGAVLNLHPNPGSAFAVRPPRCVELLRMDLVVGVYERHFRDFFPDALRYMIEHRLLTRTNKSAGAPLPRSAITMRLPDLEEIVPRMLRHMIMRHLRIGHSIAVPLFYMDVPQLCGLLLANLDTPLWPTPMPCTPQQADACLRQAVVDGNKRFEEQTARLLATYRSE
jgi:hypothetical protein